MTAKRSAADIRAEKSMAEFARVQTAKLRRSRGVVQVGPPQTVDEWIAAGNRIEVLPGPDLTRRGPMPARQSATGGRRSL